MLGYTWFWIKFSIIDIFRGSEYASSFEYASVTQGSVHIPRVLNLLGLEYTRVQCNPYFKDSRYLEFLSSEYAKGFEPIRSINML